MPGQFRNLTAAEWTLLARPRLLLMVCASALTGALLARSGTWTDIVRASLAVGLFSFAGTLINQAQERHIDALMSRTRNRPLATGRLSVKAALVLALLLLAAGGGLLGHRPVALVLGVTALVLYNLVYTPLKSRTPLALFPGAVSGALPPLVGWAACGRSLLDGGVLLFALLLAVWQVPHFLLLMLKYRDDYRLAGLPVLAEQLDRTRLHLVVACWILAVGSVLVFLGTGPGVGQSARLAMPVLGSWLI
ncbi:MAG: protoheme IX farnesyltransferase, partial [Deltaproteobacteria bacterium]